MAKYRSREHARSARLPMPSVWRLCTRRRALLPPLRHRARHLTLRALLRAQLPGRPALSRLRPRARLGADTASERATLSRLQLAAQELQRWHWFATFLRALRRPARLARATARAARRTAGTGQCGALGNRAAQQPAARAGALPALPTMRAAHEPQELRLDQRHRDRRVHRPRFVL